MDVETCPDCGVKMVNGVCPECGKPATKSETAVPTTQSQTAPGSRPPGWGSTSSTNSRSSSSGGFGNG
jgi:predicted amidophosphoribosyltransferase